MPDLFAYYIGLYININVFVFCFFFDGFSSRIVCIFLKPNLIMYRHNCFTRDAMSNSAPPPTLEERCIRYLFPYNYINLSLSTEIIHSCWLVLSSKYNQRADILTNLNKNRWTVFRTTTGVRIFSFSLPETLICKCSTISQAVSVNVSLLFFVYLFFIQLFITFKVHNFLV